MYDYELADCLTSDESDEGQFNLPAMGMLTITAVDLMEGHALAPEQVLGVGAIGAERDRVDVDMGHDEW